MAEELNNPLFEDEREFLERKKQEYERALLGEVEQIKDKGAQVGRVALVGAGLAGSVWLITKAFGGRSKRKKNKQQENRYADFNRAERPHDVEADDDFDLDDEAFSLDRSAEFRGEDAESEEADYYAPANEFSERGVHSARESAQVFLAHDDDDENDSDQDREAGRYDHNDNLDDFGPRGESMRDEEQDFDNGFGNSFGDEANDAADEDDLPQGRLDFGPAVHEHRRGSQPASSFAYDDSRRLPKSDEFSAADTSPRQAYHTAPDDVDVAWPTPAHRESSVGQRVGGMVTSFLGTTTGKAVAAQVTAAVLAYVTNKINDKEPRSATAKNADLANAPATTSFYGAAPASPSPAVSLTLTDAPTEHPAS